MLSDGYGGYWVLRLEPVGKIHSSPTGLDGVGLLLVVRSSWAVSQYQ